jgi:hypothetical protein
MGNFFSNVEMPSKKLSLEQQQELYDRLFAKSLKQSQLYIDQIDKEIERQQLICDYDMKCLDCIIDRHKN